MFRADNGTQVTQTWHQTLDWYHFQTEWFNVLNMKMHPVMETLSLGELHRDKISKGE